VFSGGADKAVRMFDLATQQATQVGAHEAPVSCLKMVEVSGQQVCLTGSWDKVSWQARVVTRRRRLSANSMCPASQTLKYWNIAQPSATPLFSFTLPERCYGRLNFESALQATCA
jgi:mRNA export factor